MKKALISLLMLTAFVSAFAKTDSVAVVRPVLSAYTLEAGSMHITQTYLSPLRYTGWTAALAYERMQAMRFDPEHWTMRLDGRLLFSNTRNPARNASMSSLGFDLGWSMSRRFRLDEKWQFYVGGNTGIDVGVDYSARNGNNPVAARASFTIGATASAIYNGYIGRVPVCARYRAELPLTGIFFSPQYGELYYEIYLGNRKGLVRGAWPGNFFRLENLATLDFRFGATVLRIGYRCDIFSSKASHIVSRRIGHTAVVGIATEWVSLSAKRSDRNFNNARIISALY